MTDVIALLAISQLVTLGALFYLHIQVQRLRAAAAHARRREQPSAPLPPGIPVRGAAAGRAARVAYASAPRPSLDQLRAGAAGVDVAELARRMHRSEEEVRLLLRRQGIAS